MKRSVKLVSIIIIIAVVAIYAVFHARKPLKAELIEVKPETVSQIVKEEGIVEAAKDSPVYSLISGEIIDLSVKEGQFVSRGELLARINTRDFEYQLARLKGELKSLKGQQEKSFQEINQQLYQQKLAVEEIKRELEKSREDYDKIKSLYEENAVARTELDAAESAVKRLENELSQQESRLELLEEQAGTRGTVNSAQSGAGNTATKQYFQGQIEALDAQINQLEYQILNGRITAPIDGVVQELNAKQGMVVSPQTPLMKIAGKGALEINAYLLTEDVIYVKPGMKVTLIQKRRDQDYKFQGIVKSIAPFAEEKVSALGLVERRIKVTIEPEGEIPELRPGYALDVEFQVLTQQNKLVVPKTCLFPYEDGDALWVVRDGKAHIQKVTKGMETDEFFVIEEGLRPGDKVIKNPQLEGLKEGKEIKGISIRS